MDFKLIVKSGYTVLPKSSGLNSNSGGMDLLLHHSNLHSKIGLDIHLQAVVARISLGKQ